MIFTIMTLVALSLILRAKIWLLIPLAWPLSASIPLMEWPFGVRDLAVLIVCASFLTLMGFKIIRAKPKTDLIDLLLLANVLYLCTVFVRNPVGLAAFNSEMVGGKPYFNVFIACLAYFVLSRVPIDLKTACRLPLFLLPAPAFLAVGALMTTHAPGLAGKLGLSLIYADFAPSETAGFDNVERQIGLLSVGLTGMQILTSYFRPLTLLFPAYFGRFLLAIVFMVAVLFSGFRSALLAIAAYIIFSSYFQRHPRDLFAFAAIGVVGLTLLTIGNGTLFDLPLAVQRALSFLPGNWDYVATADAQASIDWRVDMWSMVWHEDKWIRNRWLGDGFGITRRELALMESVKNGGVGFLGGVDQEAFMINGAYHNGPLSTIRFVGGVGLVLYYSFIVVLAARAVKFIRLAYGTALFPATLFVGMPTLLYALTYPLGTGQFDGDAPQQIFMAGLIKLVGRAADTLPKAVEQPRDELAVTSAVAQKRGAVQDGAAASLR
jgi:hypothetical protein